MTNEAANHGEPDLASKKPVLAAACLAAAAAGWGLTAAGAGAGALSEVYDSDLITIGLLTTVLAIPYAAMQLPAGHLVDRFGARHTALFGLALVVLSYLAAAAIPVLPVAFVARVLGGAGSAVGFVVGAELARRARVGAVGLGAFGGFAIGSGGLAIAVIPALEPALGWRTAWLTCAAVAAGALALVWACVPAHIPSKPHPMILRAHRPVLRDWELHRLGAVHAVTLGLGVVLGNWVAVILHTRWNLPFGTAAAIASLILLMTIASRPLGGFIASKYPHCLRWVVPASLVVCAVATALLYLPSTSLVAVAAVLSLGVASGLPFAAVLRGAQRWRPDRPAAAVGLLNALANALVVLGTPLFAAAIQHEQVGAALFTTAALWLAPIAALPRSLHSAAGNR
ncbi:nitrate/nitrite transporter [Arthrobacter sp. NPDC058130]|uniref:MFS transporter n=1 Tax=Arthrobacter sp. NPDC058130 TaxID=3346353 RepID=UPI0036F16BD0